MFLLHFDTLSRYWMLNDLVGAGDLH